MTVKVRGLKEIEQQLIALGSKDGTRILRRATFLAGAPIEERAKARAAALPNGSGAMEKAITKRVTAGPKASFGVSPEMGSRFSVEIFPKAKNRVAIALHNLFYGRKRKGIFYGHLLEWGHRIGSRKTGYLRKLTAGARRRFKDGRVAGGLESAGGQVAPRPIFLPALQAGASRAVAIFRREVMAGIARQLKRNAKK